MGWNRTQPITHQAFPGSEKVNIQIYWGFYFKFNKSDNLHYISAKLHTYLYNLMRWQHSSELTLRCHHKKYYVLDLKETVRKPGLNQLVRDHIAGPVQSNTPITACQKGSPDLVSSLATCNFTPTCLYCPVFIFMLNNPSFFFQVPCPPCSF